MRVSAPAELAAEGRDAGSAAAVLGEEVTAAAASAKPRASREAAGQRTKTVDLT
jgi:hypothetical protein